MSQNQDKEQSMEELIKDLMSSDITREEWTKMGEYLDHLRKPKAEKPASTLKALEQVVREDGYPVLIWSSGICLTVDFKDGITIKQGTEAITHDQVRSINMMMKDFKFIIDTLQKMHHDTLSVLTENPPAPVINQPEKTRFINTNNKRAFVAGMVCGRKK